MYTNIASNCRQFTPHKELSQVCDEMWKADSNRLTPEVDYQIDPQGKTRFHSTHDSASDPLFSYVNPDVLKRGTYGGKMNMIVPFIISYSTV